MPYVEVSRVLPGSVEDVWRYTTDFASFPRFMEDVISIDIVEHEGNRAVSKWVTKLEGRILRWTEEDVFDPEGHRIRYRQTDGDLKKFEGEWRHEPADGGTRVTITCDFELGIPMFAALLNPIARIKVRDNLNSMLDGIEVALGGKG